MIGAYGKGLALLLMFSLLQTMVGCSRSPAQPRKLQFCTDFESGAGQNIHERQDGAIAFSIPPDPAGAEYLWFYFRVIGAPDTPLHFIIENAAGAHQTGARWEQTQPVFSRGGGPWIKADDCRYVRDFSWKTPLGKAEFYFNAPFSAETLYVAYSYPYTRADLEKFIGAVVKRAGVRATSLGTSEEGRDIPKLLLRSGNVSGNSPKEEIWVICREHPGETPAAFICEGLVSALLDHPAGRRLLDHFDFVIIPMLNVDGVVHGYYYHNGRGVNLARDWADCQSAEVKALKAALAASAKSPGVPLVVNLHASNDPAKGHFFLEKSVGELRSTDADLQQHLFQSLDGNHPQLQGKSRVELLKLPGITGNGLYRDFGVYCLYLESNYSRGADGSPVTMESLREVGLALAQGLAEVLVPE